MEARPAIALVQTTPQFPHAAVLLFKLPLYESFLLCVTTRAWLLQGVGVAHIIESNLHVLCWPLLDSRIIEQEHLLGLLLLDLPATLLFNLQFLLCMHACQQFN